ncbi:hypothetical protein [Alienimonas chondri]|uniref:Uncharacterized protein n=1 Tax=Alienimonas chondri TaxID=2681879 RepID=A0ABX1VCH7_9PLAN|nr:hypothetical protein [Alienimonas chondri]NNJ25414.1 hypothetical protein [Alienimonas chondri]
MNISLSDAQALVLFEWLTEQEEKGNFSFDHEAERAVVWEIQAQFKNTLPELFRSDYKALLEEARAKVVQSQ